MDQRYRIIIAIVIITASAVTVSSCYQDSTPYQTVSLPPTWTPTTLPGSDTALNERTPALTVTPQPVIAFSSTKESASKSTQAPPSAQEVDAEAEATAHPVTPQSPIATPTTARIDVAGPVTVETVEPLPIGAGMPPTRLLIPALGLNTPVQTMGWRVIQDAKGVRSEWDVVDFAAGHHINSAFPGESGNVVLSGHNNIGGAVFQSVCVIGEPGVDFGLEDEMILEDEIGRRFVYQVNGWQRLEEANASISQRQKNAQYLNPTTFAQLTLVTCWPPTSNTHRVIVTGLLSGME